MKIPLNEFEQHINEAILKRGLSYFKQGAVAYVDELTPNIYTAEVEGSETYELEIEIKKGVIFEIDCSCPYDGEICKHAVAVLFALQAEELKIDDLQIQTSAKSKKNATLKEKTPKEQLSLLLHQLNKDELILCLLELAVKDKSLIFQLLSKYSYLNKEQTQEFYTKQVKNIIKIGKSQDGYINYHDVHKLENPLDELLKNAENNAAQNNKQIAIYECMAVIVEIAGILNDVDDSDGIIYDFIEQAFEILLPIASSENHSYKQELFNLSIENLRIKTGYGFDMFKSFVSLAVNSIENKTQVDLLKPFLVSDDNNKYDNEFYAIIQHGLIEQFDGKDQASEFLLNNLQHSSFREQAINKAIENKRFEQAKKYAIQGISTDKEYGGLVNQWQRSLLRIAELENDSHSIIELSIKLFNNSQFDFNYFRKAKKYSTEDEWKNIVTKILEKLNAEKYGKQYHIIAKIYFEEKEWDMLLKTISKYPGFGILTEYEKILNEMYPEQLIVLYENTIRDYLERNVDRKYYEIACKAILRLKKIIPDHKIDYLIEEFRLKYKNRKALMELINKI